MEVAADMVATREIRVRAQVWETQINATREIGMKVVPGEIRVHRSDMAQMAEVLTRVIMTGPVICSLPMAEVQDRCHARDPQWADQISEPVEDPEACGIDRTMIGVAVVETLLPDAIQWILTPGAETPQELTGGLLKAEKAVVADLADRTAGQAATAVQEPPHAVAPVVTAAGAQKELLNAKQAGKLFFEK